MPEMLNKLANSFAFGDLGKWFC